LKANTYPLVFSFRDVIVGKGFVVGIVVNGRVLLAEEDDGVWMFGVQPGGIAGGGSERSEAFCEFKRSYLSVLFDIAAEVDSYAAFEDAAKAFFQEVNSPNEVDWTEALKAVRAGRLSLPNIGSTNADQWLPKIEVNRLDQQLSPSVNAFDTIAEAA
jgi:hypothetical protein